MLGSLYKLSGLKLKRASCINLFIISVQHLRRIRHKLNIIDQRYKRSAYFLFKFDLYNLS